MKKTLIITTIIIGLVIMNIVLFSVIANMQITSAQEQAQFALRIKACRDYLNQNHISNVE